MTIFVESLDDPRLEIFTSLTDVKLRKVLEVEHGLYIAEGEKVIARACRAGHRPYAVLTQERWLERLDPAIFADLDVPIYTVTEEQLEQIAGFHVHRGALAAMYRPDPRNAEDLLRHSRTVVVLDGLVDHSNVGLAFRSCAALGADAVLLTEDCADPLYRRSIKLSMGAVFQVPWARLPGWGDAGPMLRDSGFRIAAFALNKNSVHLEQYLREPHEQLALVFGNEGHGLGPRALGAADDIVEIPMEHGVDSLNVATSVAVALFAIRYGRGERS